MLILFTDCRQVSVSAIHHAVPTKALSMKLPVMFPVWHHTLCKISSPMDLMRGMGLAQGDDGSGTLCRVWDMKSRKRVLAEALLIDSMVESCCPQRVCIVSGDDSAGSAGVVVQFGPHQGSPSTATPQQACPPRS